MRGTARRVLPVSLVSTLGAIVIVRSALDALDLRYRSSWIALVAGLVLTPALGAMFGWLLLRASWRFDRARRDERVARARLRDERQNLRWRNDH